MPTYELKCRSCGEVSEKFLARLIRSEDKVCPACGSGDVGQGVGGGVPRPVSSRAGKGSSSASMCSPGAFS